MMHYIQRNCLIAALLFTSLLMGKILSAQVWQNQEILNSACYSGHSQTAESSWSTESEFLSADLGSAASSAARLVLPDALAEFNPGAPFRVSTNLMMHGYDGSHGVRAGIQLFTSCNDNASSETITIVVEREDTRKRFGTLKILKGNERLAACAMGFPVYHDIIEYPTWRNSEWIDMVVNFYPSESGILLEAQASPSGQRADTVNATLTAVVSLNDSIEEGIALLGETWDTKDSAPAVYFDSLHVGIDGASDQNNDQLISREQAEFYIAKDLEELKVWVELLWDIPDANAYFEDLGIRLDRLRQRMSPDDFVEVAGDIYVRTQTYLGETQKAREVLNIPENESGVLLTREESYKLRDLTTLRSLFQARRFKDHDRFAKLSADSLKEHPDIPYRDTLRVARLHALFHVEEEHEAYWQLADELVQELPLGDLWRRAAYDRIVKLTYEKRYDQALNEILDFLSIDARSAYTPLLLAQYQGVLSLDKEWENLESFSRMIEAEYTPGTRQHWEARYYNALVLYHRDDEAEKAYEQFYQLLQEDPKPEDPERYLPANAASWALYIAGHRLRSSGKVAMVVKHVQEYPESIQKRQLLSSSSNLVRRLPGNGK